MNYVHGSDQDSLKSAQAAQKGSTDLVSSSLGIAGFMGPCNTSSKFTGVISGALTFSHSLPAASRKARHTGSVGSSPVVKNSSAICQSKSQFSGCCLPSSQETETPVWWHQQHCHLKCEDATFLRCSISNIISAVQSAHNSQLRSVLIA